MGRYIHSILSLFLMVIFLLYGCEKTGIEQKSEQERAKVSASLDHNAGKKSEEPVKIQPRRLAIRYGYDGEFGKYDIADNASAYDGSLLIARADALEIIEKEPGPNHILITEEHYSNSGQVIYKGTLEFQFGFDGGTIIEEKTITGSKKNNIFQKWPSIARRPF